MARRRYEDSDELEQIVSKDALFNGIGAFMAIVLFLLAVANVPGNDQKKAANPPGNVSVEAFWPDKYDADVDQWVRGPEGDPIGYSNKGGEHYNLLRDDLGNRSADDPVNYEVTFSRGIPHGEHCVNLHLYSNRSGVLPIPVKINVTITKGDAGSANVKGGSTPTLTTEAKLESVGQEINVFCFFTDKHGGFLEKLTYQSNAVRLRSPAETLAQ